MENTDKQTNYVTDDIGIGVPHCECGRCIDILFGDDDEIVITTEALNEWMRGVCPGPNGFSKTG